MSHGLLHTRRAGPPSAWRDATDDELRQALSDHQLSCRGPRSALIIRLSRKGLCPPQAPSEATLLFLKKEKRDAEKQNTLNKLLRFVEAKAAAKEIVAKEAYLEREAQFASEAAEAAGAATGTGSKRKAPGGSARIRSDASSGRRPRPSWATEASGLASQPLPSAAAVVAYYTNGVPPPAPWGHEAAQPPAPIGAPGAAERETASGSNGDLGGDEDEGEEGGDEGGMADSEWHADSGGKIGIPVNTDGCLDTIYKDDLEPPSEGGEESEENDSDYEGGDGWGGRRRAKPPRAPAVAGVEHSKFVGVTWHKSDKKWQVAIKVNGKSQHLGQFDDEEEAARKYDEAAAPFGRKLNFPGGSHGN